MALAVLVSSSVYPSGGELMTAWVPMLLPAPGLFSDDEWLAQPIRQMLAN